MSSATADQPNECIRLLAELDAVCVAGNHDLIALGRMDAARAGRLARRSLTWTREALEPAAWSFLAALPLEVEVAGGIVLTHGAIGDPEARVRRPGAARRALAALASSRPAARVLVAGNTHHVLTLDDRGLPPVERADGSLALDPARRHLVNPGSVGQSREIRPVARGAVIDTDRWWVRLVAVDYDVAAARRALAGAGLPAGSFYRPDRGRWFGLRRSPSRAGARIARLIRPAQDDPRDHRPGRT